MADAYLGVSRSLTGRSWQERLADPRTGAEISRRLDLPEIVGRVLAARGVTPARAPAFLEPRLGSDLPDPSVLRDMDAAAAGLADAVTAGEGVGILADYDVDGATSAALLVRFLRACGIETHVRVPDRLGEGYGPNEAAFDRFRELGVRLVLLVDCGTTAFGPLEYAAEAGLDCIVLDHHVAEARLPPALALVNPNRADQAPDLAALAAGGAARGVAVMPELGGLAAVGVAFLFVVAVRRELRRRGYFGRGRREPDPRQWLDLVALGTVADVMELTGLNRTLVSRGLDVIRRRPNTGIAALLGVAKVRGGAEAWHLGFVLGPRINAGGRIGDAGLGVSLLSGEDEGEIWGTAGILDRLNRERRDIEARIVEEAAGQPLPDETPFVFVTGRDWHRGVVGIVASRLVERFGRPAFVGCEEDGVIHGSARSLRDVAIGPLVIEARREGLLATGGGHAMAAGFSLEADRRGEFGAFLAERLGPLVPSGGFVRPLLVDGGLSVRGAGNGLVPILEKVGPFGRGNPEPVFVVPGARPFRGLVVGENHVRADLEDGKGGRLKAIAFRAQDTPLGDALLGGDGRALHVAGTLQADAWRGGDAVQLVVSDAAVA